MRLFDKKELADILSRMEDGQRVNLANSFEDLWPTPPYPGPDDHLDHEQRAARWLDARGATAWRNFDPPGIVVEKFRDR